MAEKTLVDMLRKHSYEKIKETIGWSKKFLVSEGLEDEMCFRELAALVYFRESMQESASGSLGEILCKIAGVDDTVSIWFRNRFDFESEDVYKAVIHWHRCGRELKYMNVISLNNKYCMLHRAAYEGNAALTIWLLDKGINRNSRNKEEQTALHVAAGKGNTEIVAILLDQGASPYVLDWAGMSPFKTALKRSHFDAADLLNPSVHCSDLKLLRQAVKMKDRRQVEYLRRWCDFGSSLLEDAVRSGDESIIEAFVPGAYIDRLSRALDAAMASGNVRAIEILLSAGAVPSKQAVEKSTDVIRQLIDRLWIIVNLASD